MAYKIEIVEQALIITDMDGPEVILDIPKSKCYFDANRLIKESIIDIYAVDSGSTVIEILRTLPKIPLADSLDAGGINPYTIVGFLAFGRGNLGFNTASGGSGATTQTATNYSSLVAGSTVGDIAYVYNSQGTPWLPGTIGGTYYPAGWYAWDGASWVSDRNAIANQFHLNQIALNSKADSVDLINESSARILGDEGSVTIHSDINDAGSGSIITDDERTAIAVTYESVSKNLRAYPFVLNYTVDKLTSIVYTVGAGSITKTFNYSGDDLNSIVLSGDTPAGIDLTKTLGYTGGDLTSITYT